MRARSGEIADGVWLDLGGADPNAPEGVRGPLVTYLLNYQGKFWADSVRPAFSGVDLKAAKGVAPAGASLVLRPAGLMTFAGGSVRAYRVSGFAQAGDGQLDYAGTPTTLDSALDTDGSLTIVLPGEAGRWVIEWAGTWATPCFFGDGAAWVNVDTTQ